jgi:long-subunit fatty acid transport protein
MREAVKNGGDPAAISNALALTMLKTQIYAAYQGTNTLQVQNLPEALGGNITTVDAAGMVADLDALISTLKEYQIEIEKKTVENEQKIRDLRSLSAAQASTLGELTEARDLAWKSYSALATKATEMSVNAQNTQVVLATSATTPKRTGASVNKTIGLAVGVGLLIGILVAYAYEFWQNYKGHQAGKISKKMFAYAKGVFHKRPSNH